MNTSNTNDCNDNHIHVHTTTNIWVALKTEKTTNSRDEVWAESARRKAGIGKEQV